MLNTIRLSSMIAEGDPAVKVMAAYHTNIGRHDHDFYELVYVTEGYCLHSVEGFSTLLMEGDVFIIPPGISHKYSGNRVTRIYNCVFGESVLEPHLAELKRLPGLEAVFGAEADMPRLRLSLNERKAFLRWVTAMCEESNARQPGWSVRLAGELVCLLVEYARAYRAHEDGGRGDSAYPAYVRQALSVIDADYADCELSVHRIAAQVGVSDDYLTRQFRQVTGISTQEYLRRYRFARAMSLLQTGCPVSEVARRIGFRSLSYFSREFSRELGIAPSKYRNQNNET